MPIYRRLTDEWQDEDKLTRNLAFPYMNVLIVVASGAAEERVVGYFRKRRQLRLNREEMTS